LTKYAIQSKVKKEIVMATIGIKLADGKLYPLIEEHVAQKKKIALTPAQDEQRIVEIVFYKTDNTDDPVTDNALRLGALSVRALAPSSETAPSIELITASDGKGKISAVARNTETGERRRLAVQLENLENKSGNHSFFEDNGQSPLFFLYEREKEKKNALFSHAIIAAAVLIAVFGGGLAAFFALRERGNSVNAPLALETDYEQGNGSPVFPTEMDGVEKKSEETALISGNNTAPQTAADAEAEQIAAETAVIEKKNEETALISGNSTSTQIAGVGEKNRRQRPPAPVRFYKIPKPFPKNGVAYRVRWGDTLWDIADAFYHRPRLYVRLARYNRLDPEGVLISGTIVRIPRRL
jgi:hypothetical protein